MFDGAEYRSPLPKPPLIFSPHPRFETKLLLLSLIRRIIGRHLYHLIHLASAQVHLFQTFKRLSLDSLAARISKSRPHQATISSRWLCKGYSHPTPYFVEITLSCAPAAILFIRQMPFGIHKHSNRSKQALNDSSSASVQGTAPSQNEAPSASSPNFATSGTADEARTTQVQTFNQQPRADAQPYVVAQTPTPEIDQRPYQNSGNLPARSQSTRYPSGSYPQQPPLAQAVNSADDLSLDARLQQQQSRQAPAQAPAVEQKKSKSIFDRMRSSRTPEQKSSTTPTQASYNNTTGLARRLSKRQENPPVIRTVQQRNSLEQQQRLDWQSAQDSKSHLPSPQEGNEDEGELDPYLIRDTDQSEPENIVQGLGLHQTIRPVQSDSEPHQVYTSNDDGRYLFQAQQPPPSPVHYQQSEGFQQNYQPQAQSYHQQLLDTRPNSLLIDNQFRQQNAETVSQLSYESPVEQREEQRPTSVQSNNGPSPTSGYGSQRQEYPTRTTSIPVQISRPLSQHTAMPPPTGASQPTRRSADPKQTLGREGSTQGQGDPPPSYNLQFPRAQPPTPGASPLPPPVGQQGPNYRGGPPQRDQYGPTGGGEQGRSTPPPAPGERDVNDAYKELCECSAHKICFL